MLSLKAISKIGSAIKCQFERSRELLTSGTFKFSTPLELTTRLSLRLLFFSLTLISCKKEPVALAENTANSSALQSQILTAFASTIATATYNDLNSRASQMYTAVSTFNAASTDANLQVCRQLWKDTRQAWEQSESFLFGPAETQNIDPRIDTWPVNYVDLDSVLADTTAFSDTYINNLPDALKGFHPIEYLLFGVNGNKTAAGFTTREKLYLQALSNNLKELTALLKQAWDVSYPENYADEFINAGESSSVYTTKRRAFEEIINSMIDICDEVANSKIEEPVVAQNPLLEESPFSANSIVDFTNNIKSVQHVYLGNYNSDNKGIEDLVRARNLSLDASIKNKINGAISSLSSITVPFGQAITTQQVQLTNAQAAINSLKETLESELLPYIQKQVTD